MLVSINMMRKKQKVLPGTGFKEFTGNITKTNQKFSGIFSYLNIGLDTEVTDSIEIANRVESESSNNLEFELALEQLGNELVTELGTIKFNELVNQDDIEVTIVNDYTNDTATANMITTKSNTELKLKSRVDRGDCSHSNYESIMNRITFDASNFILNDG